MTFDTMGAVLAGTAMMLLALAVEGLAARLGVEAIDALLARRAVGTRVWRNFLGTLQLLVTLHETFANWIAVSNRNRCLGLARPLLYTVRRGLHWDEDLELLVSP
jgi:hypothetical protein